MIVDWDRLMREALREARRGTGETGPNPRVGALVCRAGRVVAAGWHERVGGPHAEAVALERAGISARGADLVVTLEPCSRWGRTGPCTELIIAAGVKRVVVGTWDPNPAESGRGVARLRAAGIVVQFSGEWEACRKLNEPYFKYITTGVPHVTVKLACSLDGRIATGAGDAKWLSSARAMKFVHELRRDSNAVMVGGGTAAADDPELTVRRVRPRTRPLRVVVSSRLALSPELKVFQEQETVPTVVYTTEAREPEVERALLARGVAVEVVAAKGGRVSLAAVLERLGRREVSRVLVEGGGELAGALLAEGQVDRLVAIYTPLLLGRQARPSFAFDGLEKLSENPRYVIEEVKRLGPDVAVNVRVGKMWGERPC